MTYYNKGNQKGTDCICDASMHLSLSIKRHVWKVHVVLRVLQQRVEQNSENNGSEEEGWTME